MKILLSVVAAGLILGGSCRVYAGKDEPHWADVVKKYYPYWRAHYWVDRELWGNRGYIYGQPPGTLAQKEGAVDVNVVIKEEPLQIKEAELPDLPSEYLVKKGDCLWYIAGNEKIYGNPLKWPLIYKANKDKIKDPDLIYPGQVFAIPRD